MDTASRQAPAKRENLIVNLVFNVGLPFLVLSKMSKETPWELFGGAVALPGFGPLNGLLVALAFPLLYGIYDLVSRKKWNVLSIIGLASVMVSGGLGLLKLDPFWFAVKEAAVPLVIGLIVVGSQWTRKPLVKVFMLNPELIDTERLEEALDARGCRPAFERLLAQSTLILGGLFVMSSVLNFVLARLIVKSPPQTEAFNEELASMNLWSLAVIMVPMMAGMMIALYRMFGGIQRMTGLQPDAILRK